jgi:hypothetical protein
MQHILNSNKSLLNYTQWIARKQGIHFECNVFNYKNENILLKTTLYPFPEEKQKRRRKSASPLLILNFVCRFFALSLYTFNCELCTW